MRCEYLQFNRNSGLFDVLTIKSQSISVRWMTERSANGQATETAKLVRFF